MHKNLEMEYKIIEIRGRKAIAVEDKTVGYWTISLIEKGGPIISDPDYDNAIEKFTKALDLAIAIVKLHNFEKRGELRL
jgi:hypothetical protein